MLMDTPGQGCRGMQKSSRSRSPARRLMTRALGRSKPRSRCQCTSQLSTLSTTLKPTGMPLQRSMTPAQLSSWTTETARTGRLTPRFPCRQRRACRHRKRPHRIPASTCLSTAGTQASAPNAELLHRRSVSVVKGASGVAVGGARRPLPRSSLVLREERPPASGSQRVCAIRPRTRTRTPASTAG